MPITTAYSATIDRLELLDETGVLDTALAAGVLSDDRAIELYEHMSLCRTIDETLFKLQRSGRMGTFPQNIGQEAVSTGACAAMLPDDWLVPAYRENAGMIMLGTPIEQLVLYWMGDERGSVFPEGVNCLPYAVPLATQLPIAAGIAWKQKLSGAANAVLTFCGDGSTSEGDFHEALNFSSAIGLGCVFIVQNNGWAISTPTAQQSGCETFAQKALSYGIDTLQVDGNDVFAVYKAASEALVRARTSCTPTMIEAVTYRMNDHTTADDARRYRPDNELQAWANRDPLVRTRAYLESKGLWDDTKEASLTERAVQETRAAVGRAEATPAPSSSEMFDSLYADVPKELALQRDTMRTASLLTHPEQERLSR